jgi:5S rRNA maturation endonuclease (ribonuclease M5)
MKIEFEWEMIPATVRMPHDTTEALVKSGKVTVYTDFDFDGKNVPLKYLVERIEGIEEVEWVTRYSAKLKLAKLFSGQEVADRIEATLRTTAENLSK